MRKANYSSDTNSSHGTVYVGENFSAIDKTIDRSEQILAHICRIVREHKLFTSVSELKKIG